MCVYTKFKVPALAVALTGPGTCGRNHNSYRLGAILTDGTLPLSVGVNSYKTHPRLAKYTAFPHLHAESQAILRYGESRCKGLSLVVVRVKKDLSMGQARPCDVCRQFMLDIGIKMCYYSIDDEEWGTIRFGSHT